MKRLQYEFEWRVITWEVQDMHALVDLHRTRAGKWSVYEAYYYENRFAAKDCRSLGNAAKWLGVDVKDLIPVTWRRGCGHVVAYVWRKKKRGYGWEIKPAAWLGELFEIKNRGRAADMPTAMLAAWTAAKALDEALKLSKER